MPAVCRRDRWFQFALKYYAASLIVLSILLALQSHYPKVRTWNGLYIDITVVVVLSEKVRLDEFIKSLSLVLYQSFK